MYNGIGVQTPRGTGTSGHIVASLVSLKPPPIPNPEKKKYNNKQSAALEEHNKRRKIELQVIRYRQKLQKSNRSKDQINNMVNTYRESLTNPSVQPSNPNSEAISEEFPVDKGYVPPTPAINNNEVKVAKEQNITEEEKVIIEEKLVEVKTAEEPKKVYNFIEEADDSGAETDDSD